MIRRTKFSNSKQRKKKETPKVEVVTVCDQCGKDLGRTCAKTTQSSICASGDGIVVKRFYGGDIQYFCSQRCADEV